MKRVQFGFYNLAPAGDPNRGPVFVARESEAIVNNQPRNPFRRRPKVFGVVEAIDRRLPELERYDLVRDASDKSRENLALYVRTDLERGKPEWVEHHKPWRRAIHPGWHEPRATLVVPVEGWTVIVAHAPQAPMRHLPAVVNDSLEAARSEWLSIVAGLVNAHGRDGRPVLVLSDSNGLWSALGERTHSPMAGTPVESAHVLNAKLRRPRTPARVGGVELLSDHKKCLLGTAVRA